MNNDYQYRQWITAHNVARLIKYDGLAEGEIGYDSQFGAQLEWDTWESICENNGWRPEDFVVEFHCEPNPEWNGMTF